MAGRDKRRTMGWNVALCCFVHHALSSKLLPLVSTDRLRGHLLSNVSLHRLYAARHHQCRLTPCRRSLTLLRSTRTRWSGFHLFTVSWQGLIEQKRVGRCTLSITNTTLHRHAGNAAGARPSAQFGLVPRVANKEKQKNSLSYKPLNLLLVLKQKP